MTANKAILGAYWHIRGYPRFIYPGEAFSILAPHTKPSMHFRIGVALGRITHLLVGFHRSGSRRGNHHWNQLSSARQSHIDYRTRP